MKRKIHLLSLALFTAAVLATAGCGEGVSPVEDPVIETNFEPAPFTAKTTNGSIAVSSLGAQIASLEMLLGAQPQALEKRQALVDLLLLRTQFLGTFDDFEKVLSLTEDAHNINPDDSEVYHL